MSPSDLEEMLLEEPFIPIRITMNSGDQYIVNNPRHIIVTGTSAHLGIQPDEESGIPRRGKILSMINICSAERLGGLPPPSPRPRRRR